MARPPATWASWASWISCVSWLSCVSLVSCVSWLSCSSWTAAAQDGIGGLVFDVASRGEAFATFRIRCDACAWDREGREAVTLRLTIDSRYSQHLPIVRGGIADYRVALGALAPGTHRLSYERDAALTASGFHGRPAAQVEHIVIDTLPADRREHLPASMAPFVYARPNTVGRFSDVPVFMWYEDEPTDRGTRYRYSVVFTNEDGGTPADRLMATWGRTTDIEYIYSVEVDRAGTVLAEDYQGPDHVTTAFDGRRNGRHPLLWVVTDNNMVADRGDTSVRYAPAAMPFPLRDVSREVVMDANPWLYALMAQELAREGKIADDAAPGQGIVPDPRRYVYVEACGEAGVTALSFSVQAGRRWYVSDRGVPQYRIVRAGCFRGAVPLPADVDLWSVRVLRVEAHERPDPPGAGQPTTTRRHALLTRINQVFTLDEDYRPGPTRLEWTGEVTLKAGESKEFPLR